MELSKKARIYVFMPARNEERTLPQCLKSLLIQTLPPKKILVINDASTDNTQKICEEFKVDVVQLTKPHKNYVTTPELAYKMAAIINYAFPPPASCNYLMMHNPDILLPRDYLESMTARMDAAPRLVIASGCIEGEFSRDNHPRNVGRLYKSWFWSKYIKRFPLTYGFESFPLLKAQSLGFEVKCFYDVVMKAQRATKQFKADYGYAMRELGYSFPYTLGKCFMAFPRAKGKAIRLLSAYLTSPYKLADADIKRFMRYYQAKQFLNLRALINLVRSK